MVATGHILYQGEDFIVQYAHFLIKGQYIAGRTRALCIGVSGPSIRELTSTQPAAKILAS